jgi:hypothetical protein
VVVIRPRAHDGSGSSAGVISGVNAFRGHVVCILEPDNLVCYQNNQNKIKNKTKQKSNTKKKIRWL